VSVSAKSDGASVSVDVKAGRAAARATYAPAAARKAAAEPVTLYETPRVSVLHASLQDHLLRLAHERYNALAQWPDFSAAFTKDVYYRAHPEDLRKLYGLADEWHRMLDAVTEFESLGHLASQMVPVRAFFVGCLLGWHCMLLRLRGCYSSCCCGKTLRVNTETTKRATNTTTATTTTTRATASAT
jgi:hypothetical protein